MYLWSAREQNEPTKTMKWNGKVKWVALACAMAASMDAGFAQGKAHDYFLIAHRGGVVDSSASENSSQAQQRAFEQGYQMIEADLRLTRDSVFVTHHDATFKRSFGLDSAVTAMTWKQINALQNKAGYKVQRFEDVLQFCQGKMGVMIDNKIKGNDPVLFTKLIDLLKKYNLYASALMIGTDESTPFFIGKIKLSCTRGQIEEYMRKPGFNPSDYYLFSGTISKEDVAWARKHHIQTLGVINAWSFKSVNPAEEAARQAQALKEVGVTSFQIDSQFLGLFR